MVCKANVRKTEKKGLLWRLELGFPHVRLDGPLAEADWADCGCGQRWARASAGCVLAPDAG